MTKAREKFGEFIRREREASGFGLREMATRIRVSPTYLSKIERDEFPPPTEDRVKQIAEVLGLDSDQLLALAGRVSTDLTEIIRREPHAIGKLLRSFVDEPQMTDRSVKHYDVVVRQAESGKVVYSGEFALGKPGPVKVSYSNTSGLEQLSGGKETTRPEGTRKVKRRRA